MKKLICILFSILLLGNVYSADVFEEGAGADVISGSDSPADIDTLLDAALTEPVGRLLQEYRQGAKIAYSSVTTITVSAGQIAVQNSTGAIVAFLDNTSSTSVTFSNIDTGTEAASKTYYVYGYSTTPASDTDFDVVISLSSTAPSGKTYYARLGSFYNDSSSNIDITTIVNDNDDNDNFEDIISEYHYDSGWFSVSLNSTYTKTHSLGTTKVLAIVWFSTSSAGGSNVFEIDYDHDYTHSGVQMQSFTTTQITLRTSSSVFRRLEAGGGHTDYTSGYCRILLLAME